ncbi:MAG: NAD-dependent epimerase/dehydratase family protein [Candidatus Latescibacteria bacterium]|nr:NAD-dependent epimerase/dehydratase family protein [Candidatus Latescibacterota bacterium]
MRIFISGGCGFIGSHLVERLAGRHEVTLYDDLSSGKKAFIAPFLKSGKVKLIQDDLLNTRRLYRAMKGHDLVFHLAANPDIRYGIEKTDTDLKLGTLATYNILEGMRRNGIPRIAFASSSVVYGEPRQFPTPEDYGPLLPLSLYGASKLACEGLLTAFAHTFGITACIFRFANIVGGRTTHGVLHDFRNKLRKDPDVLEVLGDGKQKKSYLLVDDCISAMRYVIRHTGGKNPKGEGAAHVFNLGSGDQVSIAEIAHLMVKTFGRPGAQIRYTGGRRGWRGDVPTMRLDVSRINRLGWKARLGSRGAVEEAIRRMKEEEESAKCKM